MDLKDEFCKEWNVSNHGIVLLKLTFCIAAFQGSKREWTKVLTVSLDTAELQETISEVCRKKELQG